MSQDHNYLISDPKEICELFDILHDGSIVSHKIRSEAAQKRSSDPES